MKIKWNRSGAFTRFICMDNYNRRYKLRILQYCTERNSQNVFVQLRDTLITTQQIMGTRSWTRFYRARRPYQIRPVAVSPEVPAPSTPTINRELVGIIYQQFDGYPTGAAVVIFLWLWCLSSLFSCTHRRSIIEPAGFSTFIMIIDFLLDE